VNSVPTSSGQFWCFGELKSSRNQI